MLYLEVSIVTLKHCTHPFPCPLFPPGFKPLPKHLNKYNLSGKGSALAKESIFYTWNFLNMGRYLTTFCQYTVKLTYCYLVWLVVTYHGRADASWTETLADVTFFDLVSAKQCSCNEWVHVHGLITSVKSASTESAHCPLIDLMLRRALLVTQHSCAKLSYKCYFLGHISWYYYALCHCLIILPGSKGTWMVHGDIGLKQVL